MKIRATVTKGAMKAGEEYDFPQREALVLIKNGEAEPLVTESPVKEREKAVSKPYETR